MSITNDRSSPWGAEPSEPKGPSRNGFVIAAIIAAVLFVAVIVVAVVVTDHGKTTSVATPTTTSTPKGTVTTSTSMTAASGSSSPAAIPAAQATPPSLAGAYSTDPATVMRAITTYADWVFSHPNPALLNNYMLPTCDQYNGVKAELTTLYDRGWHARPSVTTIQWVMVNVPFTPAPGFLDGYPAYVGGGVKAVVTHTVQSSDILNAAGQVVDSAHNAPLIMLGVNFAQGPDGRFRIISEGAFNPPGGVAAFES